MDEEKEELLNLVDLSKGEVCSEDFEKLAEKALEGIMKAWDEKFRG